MLAGVVAGGVVIGTTAAGYADRIDGFDRVEVPGTMEVELDGTGGYSIYHEYAGAYDETNTFGEPRDPVDQLRVPIPTVTVTSPSGDEVELASYDTKVSYATGSNEGIGRATFHVDDPGTYVVETSGETAPGGSEIAVGRGVSAGVITGVITGLLIGFVGVVAGVVIVIVLAVRRGRNRRAQTPRRPPLGPQPYPIYGQPAGWPPGYAMQPPPMQPAAPAPPVDAPRRPTAPPPPPGPPSSPRADAPSQPGGSPPAPSPPHPTGPPPASPPRPSAPTRVEPGQPGRPASAAAPPFRDPPSLRAQDWSRDDLSLPWSPDQR